MTRSASGLATPRDDDWRALGQCTSRPDVWFEAKSRGEAMHICRTHCPVVERCLRDALKYPPKDGVQGGVAFNNDRKPFPVWFWQPARTCKTCAPTNRRDPPTDTGKCGTYAGYRRHLRRHQEGCGPCRAASAREQRRRKAARAEGWLSTPGDGPVGERDGARKQQKEEA
jgi:hypothetical protein